ncbi:MAG: insulinase family protein [Desulfuromonadales bacterium]|nr:insulinase family protein [Desulfuromonadales bacterium]
MIKPFTTTLDSGLRIVCVEMPHLHSAELAIYLKAGGRNDPRGREGLSHFLEHILFRGTADFSCSQEIENAFEAIGGTPNASTDADSTCFYSRIHPDHYRRGMEIFASMIMQPLLEGVEIEKRIITEEAREDLNEQGEEINADTIASRLLWPRHPLGMPTIGTLKSIAAITRADLEKHLRTYYVPPRAVVVVAGPVSSDAVFSAAADVFNKWRGNEPCPALPATARFNAPQIRFVHDSDSQMALQLAFLGLRRKDPRFMALRLLRRLLAGGGSSRLHLRLREELGIVYSVEAAIGAYEETGCLAIDLSTAPETLIQAIEVTLEEIVRLTREPVPASELDRVRQLYIFDLEYSRDSAYEIGGRYGWGELMGMVHSIEEDQREAAGVTSADLLEAARTVFTAENLRLVAVGPWTAGIKRQTGAVVKRFVEQWDT